MFDFDSFREILASINKNKLRTFLTSFAVAWGIFMLIILLATGNGLKNGISENFSARATNSVSLFRGWTSKPYGGLPADRQIRFDENDYILIKKHIPEVEYVSPRVWQSSTLSYGEEYGSWSLQGVTDEFIYINNLTVDNGGRFINKMDMDERRKVIVISDDIKKVLFKDEDPIGKMIKADNLMYRIIGVYENTNQFENSPPAYVPFTTAQTLYNKGFGFRRIDFTVVGLNTLEANEAFNQRLRKKLAQLHSFDPDDLSAVYIRNTAEMAIQTDNIFFMINLFLILIGAASLMAGIVGVGNIMLITVKERTREIGIRKAIGASPSSVLKLIIVESIFITTVAGYFGMVGGILVTELITYMYPDGMGGMFKDPSVSLSTVIASTIVLIVCGVIAGMIPAIKATKVSPIEAMREE